MIQSPSHRNSQTPGNGGSADYGGSDPGGVELHTLSYGSVALDARASANTVQMALATDSAHVAATFPRDKLFGP